MKERNEPGNEALDRLGRRLLRALEAEPRENRASDAAFVAGFRRKLDEARRRRSSLVEGIGGWGWRLGPMLASAAAALAVLLFLAPPGSRSGDVQAAEAPETELWAAVSEGEAAELTGAKVLDAILLGDRR
jgi:hypothetical protein